MTSIALIIATKDRPDDLRRMLTSVAAQSFRPGQVIIVDASTAPVEAVAKAFPSLNVTYLRHWPPSAAAQRNAGLSAAQSDITLVGFMDDDIVIEPDAIEQMMRFWNNADGSVGGAAFNWLNTPSRAMTGVKSSALMAKLGLYSNVPGDVAPSGWQSIACNVKDDLQTKWLSSCACVWRSEVLNTIRFDEYFDGYSYLEDLDFSFSAAKKYKLFVVASAGFRHYPATGGRISRYRFGKIEVRNRLYVVRKHGLSVWRCYVGLLIRFAMTLFASVATFSRAQFTRACGNLAGLCRSLKAEGV